MILPTSFFLAAAAAVLLTGLSKSGFGGGLGVISVPVLSVFVEPQFAVAVLMPLLITMDVIIVWQYRNAWNKAVVLTMLPGALVGLAIGLATFQWMNAETIRLAVGILAILFVSQYLLGRGQTAKDGHKGQGAFALAAVSGFASFVAHAGGPPVKGYLLRQGMDKTQFVGTNTMFFFSMNALKTVSYLMLGQVSFESLQVSLIISPLLVVGIVLGTLLHKHIDQRRFTALVYGFLALTGVKLLTDSIGSIFV